MKKYSQFFIYYLQFTPLFFILIVGFWLRTYNLDYGFPYILHPDEKSILVPALKIADINNFDPNPRFFNYPSLQIYILSFVFYLKGVIASGGSFTNPELPNIIIAAYYGRCLTSLFGVATIILVYYCGLLINSKRMGLIAAFFYAIAPFPSLDTHYLNVDVPLTFWCILAFFLALCFITNGKLIYYFLTSICTGLAFATKYTGFVIIFIIIVIFLFNSEIKLNIRKKILLIFSGIIISAIVFIICSPYTLIEFESFSNALNYEKMHIQKGQLGFDLNPGGFLYHRFIYQLGAGFPFAIGIPFYLLSIAGTLYLIFHFSKRWLPFFSGFFPLFFLICSSNVVFPRYFLPLLPFLILLSAYFVDTILSKGNLKCFRILFIILIFISIFYTGALTVSLLKSLEPQNSILASS